MTHQTIIVIDFGSQYTQLIARRLRELSVFSEILPPGTPIAEIIRRKPAGVILSGGPKSVSEPGAPHPAAAVYELDVPTLGVCYGMQLLTAHCGAGPTPHREFGVASIDVVGSGALFRNVPGSMKVWASHGDAVTAAPPGFDVVATSANAPVAAMQHRTRPVYGLLFHPEVVHTEHGAQILRNFAHA